MRQATIRVMVTFGTADAYFEVKRIADANMTAVTLAERLRDALADGPTTHVFWPKSHVEPKPLRKRAV